MRQLLSSQPVAAYPRRCVSREPLIAVIDDDEPFRTALVESLCSLGYRARGFASGEEFFAASGESSCDCVITDVHMPGMSGLDLQRLLTTRDWRGAGLMINPGGRAGGGGKGASQWRCLPAQKAVWSRCPHRLSRKGLARLIPAPLASLRIARMATAP